jgi:hypothetical protein
MPTSRMAVIDHLVYAVPALDQAIEHFESVTGVRPAFGGAHTGLGTHNALVSFGDNYLELIAPDPDQPDPAGPRPFGTDDLHGPALVTFAIRPDTDETIDELVLQAKSAGFDPGEIVPMSRRQPNGKELRWRLTFPKLEMGGAVPFIIDWGRTALPATTAPGGVELVNFRVLDPNPPALRKAHDALNYTMEIGNASQPSLGASVKGPRGSLEL